MTLLADGQTDGRTDTRVRRLLSPATAFLHDHVGVVFHHQFALVVHVEQRLRRQLGRHATRPGHRGRIHRVHQRLHDCVVGSVHVVGQRERALAVTVVRVVTLRRLDPVGESDLLEVHIQWIPLADFLFRLSVRRRWR